MAVFQECPLRERTREEATWLAEACLTAEVIGCVEQALEENKANFDHSVDTEKTVDPTNDFFIKTVTSAAKPFLARLRKDEEEWVIGKSRTSIEASRTKERRKRGGE